MKPGSKGGWPAGSARPLSLGAGAPPLPVSRVANPHRDLVRAAGPIPAEPREHPPAALHQLVLIAGTPQATPSGANGWPLGREGPRSGDCQACNRRA